MLLIWLFMVPALAALGEYILGRKSPSAAGRVSVLGSTATFGIAVALVLRLLSGSPLTALDHQLHADMLSGFVALIVALVGWMATLFAYPFLRHEVAEGRIPAARLPAYFIWSMVFVSTMTAVTVNNNIIMMYVLVEATTLASALLVTYYWKPESLEAGYKYLLLCSVGITIGLLGCVILYSAAVPLVGGANAMLITEIASVAHRFPPMVVLVAGVLVVIGFGSKAGFVPFHAWLPDAYSQSPSPVCALLSGVASKVAVYAVARLATILYPGHSALGLFAVILGCVTMLLGIVVGFQQTDLKRLLAYSSVSQIGYILFGLGIGSYLGFYGSMYHLLNHAINKALLFLCCGALVYTAGTTDMKQLGKRNHGSFLTVCFFIGSLGIAGMPPLNGFWSKFALYVAAGQAHLWWPLGIALLTSLLTMAVLIKAGVMVFMRHKHAAEVHAPLAVMTAAGRAVAVSVTASPAAAHRCPAALSAVIGLLTLLVVATGVSPGMLNRLIDLAVRALLGQMAGG